MLQFNKIAMFYIHQSACISPQQTFGVPLFNELVAYENNQLHAIEPKYEGIPPAQIRRMGQALRMGVGSGLSLLKNNIVDGIIIGTANGGIEDSISFLNQIEEYEEGRLTPTHFVQSTFNAIAGMLGLIIKNKGYNATHVHRGLAFENTVLDAYMLLQENADTQYLIGAVDEISVRNYHMESIAGWYKKELIKSSELLEHISTGMLPGEGAAMFLVNNKKQNAAAKLLAVAQFHSTNSNETFQTLKSFLEQYKIELDSIDLFVSGNNADARFQECYLTIENEFASKPIVHFKKMFGDFQTVSALALWLSVQLFHTNKIPDFMLSNNANSSETKRILIYNNYRGEQHSFYVLERV